jgi:hypothetical protein
MLTGLTPSLTGRTVTLAGARDIIWFGSGQPVLVGLLVAVGEVAVVPAPPVVDVTPHAASPNVANSANPSHAVRREPQCCMMNSLHKMKRKVLIILMIRDAPHALDVPAHGMLWYTS